MSGARQFLPNPVNSIQIGDLRGARKGEVVIEKLQSHAGTNAPRMRVNGNGWIAIPDPSPSLIPGRQGRKAPTNAFLTMRYPVLQVPLSQLRQGGNKFEFLCQAKGGNDLGRLWPQFLIYGVIFRVYYNSNKPHTTATISNVRSGAILGSNPTFQIASNAAGNIRQVDFVGHYDDVCWQGNGIERQWQYNFHYGKIGKHIGSTTSAPWTVRWNTKWVPTQLQPIHVVARITDKNGMIYVTPPVANLSLRRAKTVLKYRNTNIPKHWQARYHTPFFECETNVTHNLKKAEAARMFLTTWNGVEGKEIGVNNRRLVPNIGKNHDLAYSQIPVPLGVLRSGRNTLYTRADTLHHGIEVQWPGPELLIRYDTPEAGASTQPYGTACVGSNGRPNLTATTLPVIGSRFTLSLTNARRNSIALIVTGASDTTWGAARLPFALRAAGAPGCRLYASPDLVFPFPTDGAGRLTLPIPLPSSRAFIGTTLYQQSAVLDTTNALGAALSNGLRANLSDR